MKHLNDSIDWTSVKLCGISTPFLFINATKITTVLGIIAVASTIIYNGIRIYKELKK
jgi:H+/gluconate symporter-like permease